MPAWSSGSQRLSVSGVVHRRMSWRMRGSSWRLPWTKSCRSPASRGSIPTVEKIFSTPEIEVLVMNWAARRECAPHDHGASFGWVHVMAGTVTHTLFTLDRDGIPVPFGSRLEHAGSRYFAPRSLVHSMGNPQDDLTVTVHVYCPPITGMKVCDLSRCAACVVSDDCGAWWPDDQRQLVREIKLARSDALPRTGPVSLAELLDRTVDDAGVRDRLETNGADVASLAQLDVPVSRPRALTPISLDQDTPQLLLRAGHASSTLVVIAGRVEVVPLDRPADAVLVGEGAEYAGRAGSTRRRPAEPVEQCGETA